MGRAHAPTQRALGSLVAQNQTIPMHCLQRCIEQQLSEHALASLEPFPFEQCDPGSDILGPQVHVHRAEVLEHACFSGQQGEVDIDSHAGCMQPLR